MDVDEDCAIDDDDSDWDESVHDDVIARLIAEEGDEMADNEVYIGVYPTAVKAAVAYSIHMEQQGILAPPVDPFGEEGPRPKGTEEVVNVPMSEACEPMDERISSCAESRESITCNMAGLMRKNGGLEQLAPLIERQPSTASTKALEVLAAD